MNFYDFIGHGYLNYFPEWLAIKIARRIIGSDNEN